MRLAQHHGAGRRRQHLAKAKPPAKTIGGLGQILARIFALTDGVVTSADRAFDVAQQYVDQTRRTPRRPSFRRTFPAPCGHVRRRSRGESSAGRRCIAIARHLGIQDGAIVHPGRRTSRAERLRFGDNQVKRSPGGLTANNALYQEHIHHEPP